MDLLSSLQMAWRSILVNKMRSGLTMLGVIIGVAAVITMVALSQGTASGITDRISSMGANLLTIIPGGSGGPIRGLNTARLSMGDVNALRELPLVKRVAPEAVVNGATVAVGSTTWTTSVTGTTPELQDIRNLSTVQGDFFNQDDVTGKRKVAVLGQTTASNLFMDGSNPLGQVMRINGIDFTVIGILEPKGGGVGGMDQDDIIYIPITTAHQRFLGSDSLRSINVQAVSPEALPPLKEHITTLLRQRHRLTDAAEDDFLIQDMSEILSAVEDTTRMLTFLLGGIAAVSLLVGGIGIMNIMLVSVTERTREIGIRMAIGATTRAILSQFLIEALLLCFIGGLFGVLIGWGTSQILGTLADLAMKVSPWLIGVSLGFAITVGLVFGYYPAYKAANMNPIDALRFE